MKLRLATLNTPIFDHAGLKLNERWQTVDLEPLGLEGFAAVAKHRGRILQIHSEDAAKFEEIVPKIERALEEQAKDAAAKKARVDKIAAKDELVSIRRELAEHRDAAALAQRAANQHAADAREARAYAARAEDEVARAQADAQSSRKELEAMRGEHEQLKARLAIVQTPIASSAAETAATQLDAPPSDTVTVVGPEPGRGVVVATETAKKK